MDKPMSYQCATCGEEHDVLPDIGADFPDLFFDVSEDERGERVEISEEMCRIDDDYFIRGVIEIPISEINDTFGFGVWVSQKKENFENYIENPNAADIGPFFGWLSTNIRYYEETTLNLKTMVHFLGNDSRPAIRLEPVEHPLAIAERDGITLDEAWRVVHFYMND